MEDKRKLRSEMTRQKIIEAALNCYETMGLEKTTMETVAKEAGIGRATLYRHFTNQDEILAEAVLSEMGEVQRKIEAELDDLTDLDKFLENACFIVLKESPKKTVASQMFGSGGAIVQRAALGQDLLTGFGEFLLTDFYQEAKKQQRIADGVELSHIVEWITRFLTSYLATPSSLFSSDEELRFLIQHALIPVILVNKK